jgi:hypothetical protein
MVRHEREERERKAMQNKKQINDPPRPGAQLGV